MNHKYKTMTGIYKIISPSGKIYIGQSKNIQDRWSDYKLPKHYKGQVRLYRSIIKYGFINHNFEIIEECIEEDLNKRERFWQDYYEVIGPNGLNCILTQTDELPRKVSDYMKKQMSIRMKKFIADGGEIPTKFNKGRQFNIYDFKGNILKENIYIQETLEYLKLKERASIYGQHKKYRYTFGREYVVVPSNDNYIEYLYNCINKTNGERIIMYQIFNTGEIKRCTSSSITRVKNKVLNSKDFIYYSKKNDSIYTFIGLINNAVLDRNILDN